MAADRRPEFFKVFLPQLSADDMKLPKLFETYMEGDKSGPGKLVGPSGEAWQVSLVWKEECLCFTEGWKEFVRDHDLETGDFLVFKYEDNLEFQVTIYDQTSCEKEASFRAKCSQSLGRSEEPEELQNDEMEKLPYMAERTGLKRKRSEEGLMPEEIQVAESFGSAYPFFVKTLKKYNVEKPNQFQFPASFIKDKLLGCKNGERMVIRTEKNKSWPMTMNRDGNAIRLCAGWSAFIHDNNLKIGDICVFELVDRREIRVHGCKVQTESTETPLCPPKSSKSPSFCFSARMVPSNELRTKPYMNMPRTFSDGLKLRKGSHVKLRGPSGKLWPVRISNRTNNDACLHMSKGWAQFYAHNKLKVGDRCVFESVSGDGTSSSPLKINVMIFP